MDYSILWNYTDTVGPLYLKLSRETKNNLR